jgi:DNA-binding FadR family transcriptional regulator
LDTGNTPLTGGHVVAAAAADNATFDLLLGRGGQEPAEARLRRFIARQGLQPGDKLPSEGELAGVVGGSRILVRKALHALEALGVVEARAGLGWYVRAFNASTAAAIFARSLTYHPRVLLDLIVVWSAVEADVVPGLAGKLSAADFDVLGELADRMTWRASRREPFYREDGEFHRRLIAASRNLIALALVDLFWGVKETLYDSGFPPPKGPSQVVADSHRQILKALRDGDGPEAGRRVAEHHSHAKRYYLATLGANDQHATPPMAGEPFEALVQLALLDLGSNQRVL